MNPKEIILNSEFTNSEFRNPFLTQNIFNV